MKAPTLIAVQYAVYALSRRHRRRSQQDRATPPHHAIAEQPTEDGHEINQADIETENL
jgi:hypothetical protein